MKKKLAYEDATPEELTTAHAIFYAGRKFGSTKLRKLNCKGLSKEEVEATFVEVYDAASCAVAGKEYALLSPAIRSEISHLHGLASDFRFRRPPDTFGPSLRKEIEAEIQAENYQAVLEDWFRALLNSKDPYYGLHPREDEALIEDVRRYAQNEEAFGPFVRQKKHR
jgi:hypothetical protein